MNVSERIGLVGTSVRRSEDETILRGRGRYLDDVRIPGLLHAVFVRSLYAHARVLAVDAGEARAREGVAAVFTAAEIATVTAPLQVDADIAGYLRPAFPALAVDKVRHVGDPVAIVVARTRAEAEDAAETVQVDYEPLAAVASTAAGEAPEAALVFDELGTNVLYTCAHRYGAVDDAFANAPHVVRETFAQGRVTHAPMEGRGGIAAFDPASGMLTYHASTQIPFVLRSVLADALRHPETGIRVVTPDVGGGFGQKLQIAREDVALAAAARLLAQPVKWSEDRAENLTVGGQAREETLAAELAVGDDGTILGLRVDMVLDHGAYPCLPMPATAFLDAVRTALPGGYRIPAFAFDGRIVATNKASYVPYRGPWAAETFVREGLLDAAARLLGLEAVEIRTRNLIARSEQPARTVHGITLERMAALDTLERAAELFSAGAERPDGTLHGVGYAVLVEPAPGPPDYNDAAGFPPGTEPARLRLEPDGTITLFTAQAPNGQGHETTLAQVCADALGVGIEAVHVRHGDTSDAPYNETGTGGSRAATMATGAALAAVADLRQALVELAAAHLQVPIEDLVLEDGAAEARDAPGARLTLAELAALGASEETPARAGGGSWVEGAAEFAQPGGGWTTATHACGVEIDTATGEIRIARYLVVEDCGRMINPAIVEGQIRGGVVQGIGQALLENVAYDDDGQLLTATFMDYLLPTAVEAPPIEIVHLVFDDLPAGDFRGVAEGGAIAAPAAIANAVSDALGLTVTSLPLTPDRIAELVARA